MPRPDLTTQGTRRPKPPSVRPTGPLGVRRPNLPGVRRRSISPGLGDRRVIPPGLESFVGAAGLEPAGGSQRGIGGIGAGDPNRGLGTIGPDANSFDPNRAFGRDAGPGVPGFLGDAARDALANPQGRATAPPGRSEQQQRVFDLGSGAEAQGRRFGNNILAPVPFQSFDDFFRARALASQARNFANNPFPAGGGNRFTVDQARTREAGGDPGQSTFIANPFRGAGGAAGGAAGGPPGTQPGAGAVPPQDAAPPGAERLGGGFGSGGSQRDDLGGGAGAGFNLGLQENQAVFAALREQFMRALIPLLGGGLR